VVNGGGGLAVGDVGTSFRGQVVSSVVAIDVLV
jgi:hypothetical protein